MHQELHNKTLAELGLLVRSGDLAAAALMSHFLDRVAAVDGVLGAFRQVDAERAMDSARRADLALAKGPVVGPLHGLPYAVKDLIDVAGLPTTAGSSLLAKNVAHEDAAVVQRLSAAGMIPVGKTNTVQFAYGGVGINHDQGTPRNPWREEPFVPGGSSSGSAVSVAAGLVPMALGTDTGGSVRIPAALCGVTGLKTTVGRVSRSGVYPLSRSLDSVGPLCRSVEDAALIFDAIHGPDPLDPSTRGVDRLDDLLPLAGAIDGMRLAFPETVFWDDADPEVALAVRSTADVFRSLGATVESISFPQAEEARRLNPRGLVIAAEAYAVNRHWVEEHLDDLDPIVGRRLLAGRDISAADYLDNVRAWERLRIETEAELADFDGLLCPTTPIAARPTAEVDEDVATYLRHNLLYLRNTTIGNILGFCALSLPCGSTTNGLPIGLMLYGEAFAEERLLRLGLAFQSVTDWHRAVPPIG